MDQLQLDLVKGIYDMGFPIESYVPATISAEQYEQLTGKPSSASVA